MNTHVSDPNSLLPRRRPPPAENENTRFRTTTSRGLRYKHTALIFTITRRRTNPASPNAYSIETFDRKTRRPGESSYPPTVPALQPTSPKCDQRLQHPRDHEVHYMQSSSGSLMLDEDDQASETPSFYLNSTATHTRYNHGYGGGD